MSQRQPLLLIAFMVIVCSILVALPALAESNVRIVRLSYIDGDAQINPSNQDDGFTHAILNSPVTAGMWVYTPNGAHAEVQFENGSTVRLVDDAQIQFEKLALADSGGKINIINVDHGVVYFNFDKVAKDDLVEIKAGGRTFRVEKASHMRVNANDKDVVFSVFKGEAVVDGDQNAKIKGNESLKLASAKDAELKVGKGIDELGSDAWDTHRDGQMAAVAFKKSPVNYPDAYSAQFSYLGAYGNYVNIPGYGWGWQPFNMGMGWDPFMNGLWSYYPGYGYMWVSSYPWGWAPYRYGMWNYYPSYGWLWMPGTNFNAWNVGPRYGSVPSGWRAPTLPTATTRMARTVVVGHPPNLHPAVVAGRAEVSSHSLDRKQSLATRTTVSTAPTGAKLSTRAPIMQQPTNVGRARSAPLPSAANPTAASRGGQAPIRTAPMHTAPMGGARPATGGASRPK